jgi:hypothetical protein
MAHQVSKEQPRTWNAASAVALSKILPPENEQEEVWNNISDLIASMNGSSENIIKMLRTQLDLFINDMFYDNSKNGSTEWKSIGRLANMLALSLGHNLSLQHVHQVLCRKQHDYGHENIQRFGRAGLMVRVHDKVARLENLIGNSSKPNNESIQDNVMDVIGYAAIGIMWESGTFLLKLEKA